MKPDAPNDRAVHFDELMNFANFAKNIKGRNGNKERNADWIQR